MSLAFALAFTFGASGHGAVDAWTGRDKWLHFVAAAAVQSAAYTVLRQGDGTRSQILWRATAVTAAVSVGKEVVDARRGGAFSRRDLVWDAAGAGAASVAIIRWSRK